MERAAMRGSFYYMLWLLHYKTCVISREEHTTLASTQGTSCQKCDWVYIKTNMTYASGSTVGARFDNHCQYTED